MSTKFYLDTPSATSAAASTTSVVSSSADQETPRLKHKHVVTSTSYGRDDQYEIDNDDDGDEDEDELSTLPFPAPLTRSRSAFLTPSFDATDFLSSLTTSRFQTLEDLSSELSELLQQLGKELVDLVNADYHNFLSLGTQLSGGEEKVEEIRVGLLSFQRDVSGVKDGVELRKEQVQNLLEKKRGFKREINLGRGLLEWEERVGDLEWRLDIPTNPSISTSGKELSREDFKAQGESTEDNGNEEEWSQKWTKDEDNDDDDTDDDEQNGDEDEDEVEVDRHDNDESVLRDKAIPSRLRTTIERYMIIQLLERRYSINANTTITTTSSNSNPNSGSNSITKQNGKTKRVKEKEAENPEGNTHPFITSQHHRILKIRSTITSDLDAAIRQETDDKRRQKIVRLKRLVRDADQMERWRQILHLPVDSISELSEIV